MDTKTQTLTLGDRLTSQVLELLREQRDRWGLSGSTMGPMLKELIPAVRSGQLTGRQADLLVDYLDMVGCSACRDGGYCRVRTHSDAPNLARRIRNRIT